MLKSTLRPTRKNATHAHKNGWARRFFGGFGGRGLAKGAVLGGFAAMSLMNVACTSELGQNVDTALIDGVKADGQSAIIVGAVDWVDVTGLRDDSIPRQASRSVGYLNIPAKGTRCTAFLVAEDVVMTNEHCIGNASHARGATVRFRMEAGVSWNSWATYTCDTFIGNDARLDYALLRCDGAPGATFGVTELNTTQPDEGDDMFVIHQNCDYHRSRNCSPTKKYSPGTVLDTGSRLEYDADTLGGSSGSPVFDTDGTVVAIHNLGIGSTGGGRGRYNAGVPMSRIVPELERRFSGIDFGPQDVDTTTPDGAAPADTAAGRDAFEPNDTPNAAGAVQLGYAADLRIADRTDVDFFSFAITRTTSVTVQTLFSHADGDLDLALIDGRGQVIARSQGTSDQERISRRLAPGIYAVQVYGYNGATGDYTLSLD